MAVIPVDFIQVTHNFSGVNCPNGAAVVYGVENSTDLDLDVAAGILQAAFVADPLQRCTSDVTLDSTLVKEGPNDTGAQYLYSNGPHNGAQSATSNPPNVSYLVTKSSPIGGRRGSGRMFLPGTDADNVNDSGVIDGTLLAAFQTDLNQWLAALGTASLPMVLLHSPSYTWTIFNGQPRRVYDDPDTVPSPYLVTGLTLASKVSTQRRRLR